MKTGSHVMIIKEVIKYLLLFFISIHWAYPQKLINFKILGNCYNNRIQVCDNNGHVGYVNIYGDLVVPVKYMIAPRNTCLSHYNEGFAVVCYNDHQFGWIDTTGNQLDKNKYLYCSLFSNNSAIAIKQNKIRSRKRYLQILMDSNKVITYNKYKTKRYLSNCMYYKIDDLTLSKEGFIPVYNAFDSISGFYKKNDVLGFKEHYISLYNHSLKKWGLFDDKGTRIIDFISDSIIDIYSHVAVIRNRFVRIFNLDSHTFYPNEYTSIIEKDDYLICKNLSEKYDVYSPFGECKRGEKTLPIVGCVKDPNTRKYGYYGIHGKMFDCIYDKYIRFNKEGYAMVFRDGLSLIIDINGDELLHGR